MSTPVIAFFNNKGGVGKTTLVYHLAWMYADLGKRVVAADLDPQANLTTIFLDEDSLEQLWPDGDHPDTVFGCVQPLIQRTGDVAQPHLEDVDEGFQPTLFSNSIALLAGDLLLSSFEDDLLDAWPGCLEGNQQAFRVISAFWHIMQQAADIHQADLILMDLGPNLGAINRSALIAADYVVTVLSTDLFSLQGLPNLGPTLRNWRSEWKDRLARNKDASLPLPEGKMQPIGYVVLQHTVRTPRASTMYDRITRIPKEYKQYILEQSDNNSISVLDDPNCLALLKPYRSLMPMAQEAHKPMFHLKPADGAIGSHTRMVQITYTDFEQLAKRIATNIHISI
jgi:chromosome partitioning protein